ncbi:MAG: hypothetical protein KJ698_09725 [Actinobacteria bacterium]|nr:hypothetical protein [Actinomycetota bacterium]MBU1494448.1 hypothetical protein [Actinomycetota bacterium]
MTRAAWRPVAYVLLAIPMVLLAVDMMVSHKWFPEPDSTEVAAVQTFEDGSTLDTTILQLTLDGKAQQRREVFWGILLITGGVAAAGWGLKDLLSPRRVLILDSSFLALRVGSRVRMERRYAWSEVADVRSGVLEDEAGRVPVLSLRFTDDSLLPPNPWGAVVDPPWLHLYADEWDRQAHEIAPMIEAHIAPFRSGSGREMPC